MSAFKTFKRIAVFGSADVSDKTNLYDESYVVAQYLAKEGVVINGGGPGVMLAATLGAQAVGGRTMTISFHPKDATMFEGSDDNNLADENIDASNYPERVNLLVEHSDAFVILNGGTGTLSEWAMVWLMAHIYYGKHKPFVLLGDFWHEILDVVTKHMFIGEEEWNVFEIVSTPEEVVPALQRLEQHLLDLQREPILTIPDEVIEDASASVVGSEPSQETLTGRVRQMLAPKDTALVGAPPSRFRPHFDWDFQKQIARSVNPDKASYV